MKRTRKCAFCGKEFTVRSGSQRYCSEECATRAKEQRKKQRNDFLKAAQPVMDIQGAEYLSFVKAAILMGCSRQYIYKLVAEKKLPASRISNRMSFVRKADIETMLAANPYHRVLPGTKPKAASDSVSAKGKGKNKTSSSSLSSQSVTPSATNGDAILDYISGEDVMTIYKVKRSWLYASAKRNQIPICKIDGINYYSRKHLDDLFGVTAEIEALTEWLTADEAESIYGASRESLRTHAYRRHIPTKREYGQTYYSKKHLDEIFRPDLMASDEYYTVEQVQEKYGYTKSNICHIVKVNHIAKVKVGVKNLLLKADVDRVMVEKKAKENDDLDEMANVNHPDKVASAHSNSSHFSGNNPEYQAPTR